MKFIKDQRGQAGDVFRLMIDSIIGLAILVIILSSINYFGSLRSQISIAEMRGLVESGVQTPTGRVLESNNLSFSKGEAYSSVLMEQWTGVPESCFSFESGLGAISIVDDRKAEFTSNVDTKVYVSCIINPNEICEYGDGDCGSCEFDCIISFGRKPSEISD